MSERSNFLVKHLGLRGIAIFEAGKGVLALLGGIWLLSLRHKDLQVVAEHILESLHINPDHNLYRAFMRGAGHVTTRTLWLVFSGVLVYVAIRFLEAAGLWLEREWAEWFALLSSSMYMPWEIYELIRRASWLKWGIFGINVVIVLYLLWLRISIHREKKAAARAKAGPPAEDLDRVEAAK